MFFINRGRVEVVSEDGEVVFATMNEGKFFGEISLVFSVPRTASIRYYPITKQWYIKQPPLYCSHLLVQVPLHAGPSLTYTSVKHSNPYNHLCIAATPYLFAHE